MGALKDVTGALAPYAILGGLALAAWMYRDQILNWITGGITGAGAAARDVVEDVTGLPTNDPQMSDQYCREYFGAGWVWDPWLKCCRNGWTGQTETSPGAAAAASDAIAGAGAAVRDVVELITGLPTNDPQRSDQYCRDRFGSGHIWDPWKQACVNGWTGQVASEGY